MNEIAKVFSSLLLLGAGFVGASMFGPPDLVDQLAAQWKVPPTEDPQGLRPLEQGIPHAPSQLPSMVAQATPIHGSQVAPIRQMASHADTATLAADVDRSNQGVTTIWNNQTEVAATQRPNTDWLNAIHADTNRPTMVAADPIARVANKTIDATSPDAWGVPSWEGSSQFASQSNSPDSSDLLAAPQSEPTQTKHADDSFWNHPLRGPQNANLNDPVNDFALTNSNQASVEEYEASRYEPSPFGQLEAPAVQRIDLPSGPERTHVVTDGDTLPMLAERYLGDAGRAQELYELNRDRLQHPDLLPIGIILRTPQAPVRRTEVHATARLNSSRGPYPTAWQSEMGPSFSHREPLASTPFSTISDAKNSSSEASSHGGNYRQSQLVPIGESAELPAAPVPTSNYQQDWSW